MTGAMLTLHATGAGMRVVLTTRGRTVEARVRERGQLLSVIDAVLRKARVPLRTLARVAVDLPGGTFSETRTVVTTANALGYALGIPPAPHFVSATYRGEPSIGMQTIDA